MDYKHQQPRSKLNAHCNCKPLEKRMKSTRRLALAVTNAFNGIYCFVGEFISHIGIGKRLFVQVGPPVFRLFRKLARRAPASTSAFSAG